MSELLTDRKDGLTKRQKKYALGGLAIFVAGMSYLGHWLGEVNNDNSAADIHQSARDLEDTEVAYLLVAGPDDPCERHFLVGTLEGEKLATNQEEILRLLDGTCGWDAAHEDMSESAAMHALAVTTARHELADIQQGSEYDSFEMLMWSGLTPLMGAVAVTATASIAIHLTRL